MQEPISVLNLGTFHMGGTSDKNKIEFDPGAKKNIENCRAIAARVAEFNPNVLALEYTPSKNSFVRSQYRQYLNDQNVQFDFVSEIHLIAFEVGRLCEVQRIYGIDHRLSYDYEFADSNKNRVDVAFYREFQDRYQELFPIAKKVTSTTDLREKLRLMNSTEYYDFMIMVNADILTHYGGKSSYEGADQAAKFYQRNLRMYANFNKLPLAQNDRVFLMMGAAHSAYFHGFLKRNPKYGLCHPNL